MGNKNFNAQKEREREIFKKRDRMMYLGKEKIDRREEGMKTEIEGKIRRDMERL